MHNDLNNLRDELENGRFWVASRWRENAALVAQGVITTTDLIQDAFGFLPKAEQAQEIVQRAVRSVEELTRRARQAENAYNGVKLYKDVLEVSDKGLTALFITMALEYAAEKSVVMRGVATAKNLAENIADLRAIPKDADKLRMELASQTRNIDRQLRELEEKILSSRNAASMIEQIGSAIDGYCRRQQAPSVRLD